MKLANFRKTWLFITVPRIFRWIVALRESKKWMLRETIFQVILWQPTIYLCHLMICFYWNGEWKWQKISMLYFLFWLWSRSLSAWIYFSLKTDSGKGWWRISVLFWYLLPFIYVSWKSYNLVFNLSYQSKAVLKRPPDFRFVPKSKTKKYLG